MFSNEFNYNLIIYKEMINSEISYLKHILYKTNHNELNYNEFHKKNQEILNLIIFSNYSNSFNFKTSIRR